MLDFNTCLAIAGRANRNSAASLGSGRSAVGRLAIALALIGLLFGSLGIGAGGTEQGIGTPDQFAGWSRDE